MIRREKVDEALAYLISLIQDHDVEYPDAEFKAFMKYGVPTDTLRNAYDEHCATK